MGNGSFSASRVRTGSLRFRPAGTAKENGCKRVDLRWYRPRLMRQADGELAAQTAGYMQKSAVKGGID